MWRSLEELAVSAEAEAHLHDEFPGLAARIDGGLDRRPALKFMGAALALGGLAGCDEPEEILPYVNQPEGLVPGKPRYKATTLLAESFGIGALVESHEGRPTKVEGNPDHPASLGAALLGIKFYEWYDEFRKGLMPFLGLEFTYEGPSPSSSPGGYRRSASGSGRPPRAPRRTATPLLSPHPAGAGGAPDRGGSRGTTASAGALPLTSGTCGRAGRGHSTQGIPFVTWTEWLK